MTAIAPDAIGAVAAAQDDEVVVLAQAHDVAGNLGKGRKRLDGDIDPAGMQPADDRIERLRAAPGTWC